MIVDRRVMGKKDSIIAFERDMSKWSLLKSDGQVVITRVARLA